ncbi:hypothetical protein BGZ60DRAFT_428788 [Tricladium varicosporioides]|nr:hypothetical protein BGZ60DRAFT_428788 [Hymenoscyphus varicosporioides]
MNWATIAPDTRLYKGKNLFRWDVSPGLGIGRSDKLPDARAKTTCIGKHVEPCYRFHQQLHFVGKSHECFGCNSSDEMHHNRHKEILRIIRQIELLDTASAIPTSKFTPEAKARRESIGTPTDTSSETFSIIEAKQTRRKRKKAKKTGIGYAKERKKVESFPQEELDFVSEALHLTVHESKGAWEGTYNYDKKPTTAEKIQGVDLESEIKEEEVTEIVTECSIVLNLNLKPSNEITPRQRKVIKKYNNPIDYSSFGSGSRKHTPNSTKGMNIYNGLDPQIFFRLGIEMFSPQRNSKARKDLVLKLIDAVSEDIGVIEREDEESAMRKEGFWRWAGKTAYHHMSLVRENIDWATGQKKGPQRNRGHMEDGIRMGTEFESLVLKSVETDDGLPDELSGPAKAMPFLGTYKGNAKIIKGADATLKDGIPNAPEAKTLAKETTKPEKQVGVDHDGSKMVLRYQECRAGKCNIGRTLHFEPVQRGKVLRIV